MNQGFDLYGVPCPIAAAARLRYCRLGAAALLLSGLSCAVSAQTQETPAPAGGATAPGENAAPSEAPVAATADDEIGEVLVTARRREERAQSVPLSVSVLGSEALEDRHIQNLDDLQSVVPALSVSATSGRPNSPVYSLRGIRPTESVYGQDPTVAVYFADFVLSPAEGTNLGLYDLSSVQVLKGPQGTLFGRNTTGGAMLLTPRRPGHAFASDVMVGYGSYGLAETQVGIDMPLAETFALRLAGRTVNSDGYQTNVEDGPLHGDKLGGENTRSIRLSALWNPRDDIENYTVLSYDRKSTNGRGSQLVDVNPDNTYMQYYDGTSLPSIMDALARARSRNVNDVESDMRQYDDIDVWSVIDTLTVQIGGGLTLKSIAGYRDFQTGSSFDIDSTEIPGLLTAGPQKSTLQHASYELQLLGTAFDDRLNWVTGLYYYFEDGFQQSPGDVFLQLNPTGNPYTQRGDVRNMSYSLFAQGTYRLDERWSLTAGVRGTRDDKEMTVSSHTPTACALEDADGNQLALDHCAMKLSDSFSQPTGTLSVDYKPREHVLLYLSSRLGYRAGGFNLRADTPVEYEPFDPETVTDLELGTKTDWTLADWKMRSNLALYNQWYNDIQRTVAAPNASGVPGSAIQNAAKATVFGVELEQTIAPTRHLSLQLNYAYTLPKYEAWSDPATGYDESRTPFYFTPRNAGNATLSYTLPLRGDAGALLFSAIGSYKSHTWINALQTIKDIRATPLEDRKWLQQDEYWLLDLNASWTEVMGSKFDVSAYMKNVTDTEYAVGGVQLYTTIGIITRAYGEPRTYGMQLRYRF
ncbi:MAG: TonB-dependent receptor [Solimonas sp.]